MVKLTANIKDQFGDELSIAPRRSLSEEAADRLRELILEEKLPPGRPVPERELSEALGISRTPLKDALRILEAEGLIEYSATRRPSVADPSVEELRQHITVLGGLEGLAGEIACKEASDEEIAAICAIEEEMRGGAFPEMAFFERDMAFHRAIVAAAHNAPLIKTHGQYNARLWRARFLSSRQQDRRANTNTEHRRIAAALAARDAAETSAALRDHLRSTIDNIARVRSQSTDAGTGDKAGSS